MGLFTMLQFTILKRRHNKLDSVFTYCLYGLTLILLLVSLVHDRGKTLLALKKSLKMFISVLPQFLTILLFVGLLLAVLDADTIQRVVGAESGFMGMLISSILGAISLVPVVVAFPIASELLDNGAGIMQITVFISTLTTVGIVTLSLEAKYLGKKVALLRNGLFFICAFFVAIVMEIVL